MERVNNIYQISINSAQAVYRCNIISKARFNKQFYIRQRVSISRLKEGESRKEMRCRYTVYSHGAYMRQSVERALHNAGYGIPVQVPAKITFRIYIEICIFIYTAVNTVLWRDIKVSTHRVLRFVSPVNILLWTSLSLFSDNNLRNESSLLHWQRYEYKAYGYEILKRKRGKRESLGIDAYVIVRTLKICIAQKLFFFFFEKRNDLEKRKGEWSKCYSFSRQFCPFGIKFSFEKKVKKEKFVARSLEIFRRLIIEERINLEKLKWGRENREFSYVYFFFVKIIFEYFFPFRFKRKYLFVWFVFSLGGTRRFRFMPRTRPY